MHTGAVLSRAGAAVAGLLLAAACTAHHSPAAQRGQHARQGSPLASSTPGKAAPKRVGFTIAATGDLLAHEPVVQTAQAAAGGHGYDFRPLLAQVRPILSRADLAICHLETPLSPDDRRISYYPDFQAPREIAPAIRWAGFDTCTTASNHTLDDGPAGVAHTLALLDAAGVQHVGAARNTAEAAHPRIYRVRGYRVGHLDYTYGLNGRSVPAGQPWLVPLIDPARILRDAHAARAAGAQFVIVSFHWGQEYSSGVTADQRAVARRLLASPDVDLVLGSHAHVLQAVERIDGKFVVYGMGNFLARHASCCDSPPTFDGVIVNLTVAPRAGRLAVTALTYTPTHVNPNTLVVEPIAPALHRLAGGAARTALIESWGRTVARMDALHAAVYGVRPDDPPAGLPTS